MIRSAVLVLIITAATAVIACEPEDYFLFNGDACERLNEIDSTDIFSRVVLLNNIAFHRENDGEHKRVREKAQQLLKPLRQNSMTPTLNAYWWALRVMEIRDWGKFKKFYKGARGKIREAFDGITVALA